MSDQFMREYIELAQACVMKAEPLMEAVELQMPELDHSLVDALNDLCFKLRAHSSDEAENALGVEMGMEMAADMIENLLKHYNGQ